MSKIFYAVEIWTNTSLSNATYGIIDGVFRFITDRPGYLSIVTPEYGPDEINAAGGSIGGDDVAVDFYEGFLLKESFSVNPNRSIDIASCGNYSTDSQFSFTIRNDLKFWDYCQTNGIYLTGQRVVMWVIDNDVFYQCARGRITNNPYTEANYQFDIEDDATLIHKDIPPRLSVLPAVSAELPAITQGDPIPVVFGNVPYSKILKNNSDNYVLPLNSPYLPAAATLYAIAAGVYSLTLHTGITDFGINDARLVGRYLYVVAGATADRVYKIISNGASVGNDVTIDFNSPLVISTAGDSSTDVLVTTADFNNPANHYILTGGATTAATWWFQISDYSQASYVSNNPVTVSDVLEYDKDIKAYNSVANLLDLTSTPNPTIKLTANTATKTGATTQYERINVPLLEYGAGHYAGGDPATSEFYNSPSDLALVTDKLRATYKQFVTTFNPARGAGWFDARFTPQPLQPSYLNQVLAKAYNAIYLCFDFDITAAAGGSGIYLWGIEYSLTDVNGSFFNGPAGPTPDPAYYINMAGTTATANYIPNHLITDNSSDPTTLFGAQAKTDGTTYRVILKVPDTDPSAFASPQITKVSYRIWFDNSANIDVTVKMKEICLVGELSIDTMTADLFARTAGEIIGAGKTDAGNATDDVYHAFIHILEDYDAIPAALIDYGTVASYRTLAQYWGVSRTLTERKNSVEYLNELCAHSFVGMFSGRTGKRVLSALVFTNLIPTTGNGKTPEHDSSLIVRNSISNYVKSSISNVYNSFNLQYHYDAASSSFLRSFNIANVDQSAFPAYAIPDPTDATIPLWWSYCSGLQTDKNDWTVGYVESGYLWSLCHDSYVINSVIHQAQADVSQLNWFGDSLIWDASDTSCTGLNSSAYTLLYYLIQWCTLQKDIVSYSIPLNENTYGTELLDIVNFNDIIYTNGNDIPCWVIGLEVDTSKDQLNLQVMLQPLSLAGTMK